MPSSSTIPFAHGPEDSDEESEREGDSEEMDAVGEELEEEEVQERPKPWCHGGTKAPRKPTREEDKICIQPLGLR